MIVQSFRSVLWVGAVAGAALSCYMVSLRVASERAALERVEARILMAKRDIRALDTELVTRGRVRQLERWNTDVLALAPPTEGQFLQGEMQLASLTRVDPVEPPPLVLAVAPDAPVAVAKPLLASYTPDKARALGPARLIRASAPAPRREPRMVEEDAKPVAKTKPKPEAKPLKTATDRPAKKAAKPAAKALPATAKVAKAPVVKAPVAKTPAAKAKVAARAPAPEKKAKAKKAL